ncbi:MAG: HlyC/CorC family transporter, partial [Dehalococcoidia bacterium]|nr:HlyC/CorC family transporter [Dehalococcoidia bacterium]
MQIAFNLLAVLLLVAANGFFVAAEFGLVAVRRSRVEQLIEAGHPIAPAVKRGIDRLNAYLAVCQLGITMASLALGWIGEPTMAAIIMPLFDPLPENFAIIGSHAVAVTIAFVIISALHIIVGEQAPKILAIQRSEAVALFVALPMGLLYIIFRPAIWLLNGATNIILRLIGLKPGTAEEMVHSVEELRYLVAASHEAGVLDKVESEMVGRVFEFGETRAHQVMVPRTEIAAVSADSFVEDAVEQVVKEGYSRLPVYEDNLDNIVGIVHLRDIVKTLMSGHTSQTKVRAIMREPLVLPESVSIET